MFSLCCTWVPTRERNREHKNNRFDSDNTIWRNVPGKRFREIFCLARRLEENQNREVICTSCCDKEGFWLVDECHAFLWLVDFWQSAAGITCAEDGQGKQVKTQKILTTKQKRDCVRKVAGVLAQRSVGIRENPLDFELVAATLKSWRTYSFYLREIFPFSSNGAIIPNWYFSTSTCVSSETRFRSTMVKTFQAYLPLCHRTYSCIHCRAHLANHDELISKVGWVFLRQVSEWRRALARETFLLEVEVTISNPCFISFQSFQGSQGRAYLFNKVWV